MHRACVQRVIPLVLSFRVRFNKIFLFVVKMDDLGRVGSLIPVASENLKSSGKMRECICVTISYFLFFFFFLKTRFVDYKQKFFFICYKQILQPMSVQCQINWSSPIDRTMSSSK